jgi:hypothetical protein
MTWIILPPERLIFAVGPEDKVYVQLRYSPEQTGLAPDVELAIALTPAEARAFQMFCFERRVRRKRQHGNAGGIEDATQGAWGSGQPAAWSGKGSTGSDPRPTCHAPDR